MSLIYSANTVTNGLVFSYDQNNQKSYKGPPIQNLCSVIVPVATSGTNIEYTTGYSSVVIPTLGQVNNIPYVDGYNSNSGSYCCMQQFYYVTGNGSVSCSGSTTYTYAIVYKSTSGYTHPNFMYRYEYTSGDAYVGEAGVHSDSNRIHLGNGWYWAWATFTTAATTAKLALRFFYYQYNVSDRVYVAKVMVTPGNYTSMHPRLWPDLGTTRSNTQALIDLTSNNTITASSLTYASDGTFSFNGTNGYVSCGNLGSFYPQGTISFWMNSTSVTSYRNPFHTNYTGSGNNTGIRFEQVTGGSFGVVVGNDAGTYAGYTLTSSLSANTWYYVTVTWSTSTNTFTGYINGVQSFSSSHTYWATQLASVCFGVGFSSDRFFSGSISNASIYNRALSAAEVKQNFNALRGRFGI